MIQRRWIGRREDGAQIKSKISILNTLLAAKIVNVNINMMMYLSLIRRVADHKADKEHFNRT